MDDYVGHLREFRRILRNLESQTSHPLNRETLLALAQKLDRDESQLNADRLEGSLRATVDATRTLEELSDYERDVLAVFQEIVSRKRGELERQRFRELLDASAESIFVVDPRTGGFVDVNDTAVRVLGYTRDELLELSLNHIEVALPLTPSGGWQDWVESLPAGGEPVYLEGVHRRNDGTRFSVEASFSLLVVDRQRLLLVVARDVTERKRAEARLRRQWSFFSRLAQRSIDGVLAFDRSFNVTYWNPAMERLLGERKSKVLGKNVFQVLPQLKEIGEDRFFKDALAGTSSSSRNRPFTQAETGREVYFDGYYSPLTEGSGEILGGIGILREVTERRETQLRQAREASARLGDQQRAHQEIERRLESELLELRRENERLRRDRQASDDRSEEAVRAERTEGLEVLARGVAREVEPLMAGILSQTGVALAELPTSSPLRRGVEEIEEAALSANDLAATLVAFCGNGRAETDGVQLADLVLELEHTLRQELPAGVTLELPDTQKNGPGPSVRGDPRLLKELLLALVANAVEATAATGGVIRIATGTKAVDTEQLGRAFLSRGLAPGTYAFLSVEDTGEGMDEETRSRMFVPFFTTREGRRGLGLAQVLGIVRSHGGMIDVDTSPGEGTTVRAFFPPS